MSEALGIVGVVTGTAGLVLGLFNYLRDRPRILVTLKWDMAGMGPVQDANQLFGLVRVTNIGRRPIYISHAALRLPKGHKYTHLVIRDAIRGERLAEGDAPAGYLVSQEGMEQYAKDWKRIRAVVSDSAGKDYYSKAVHEMPSWAK